MSLIDWTKETLLRERLAGRRVLVTGGAGFIGSHLCDALAQLEAEVMVLDDLSGGDPDNLSDFQNAVELEQASVTDASAVRRVCRECDVAFHLAALGSAPGSVENPRRYHEVNCNGTLNLLEAAREADLRRVVFAASAAAYGDDPTLPKVETMAPRPRSPYAAHKLAGEHLVRAYAANYPVDGVSLRLFNVFGPRQNANTAYAAVISAFAQDLIDRGRPPTIFGDGEQSRDFVYVENVVLAMLLASTRESPLDGEVFNIATGTCVTINQLARTIAAAVDRESFEPRYQPERPGDVRHSQADISRAGVKLAYQPRVDFQTGLAETMAWRRKAVGKAAGAG